MFSGSYFNCIRHHFWIIYFYLPKLSNIYVRLYHLLTIIFLFIYTYYFIFLWTNLLWILFPVLCKMNGVLVMVATAVMKYRKESDYFGHSYIITVHHQKQEFTQWRNLETGAEAKVMKRCCLLECPSWLA